MYTCANCSVLACASEDRTKMPANCPMRNQEVLVEILKAYQEPENHEFYVKCSALEAEDYCQWPRLKETVELCKRMGYHKIGLAFCKGLRKEARVVADLLRSRGFEVVSVICKTGGFPKEAAGIPKENKIHPDQFEPMCRASTSGVRTHRKNERFSLAPELLILLLGNPHTPCLLYTSRCV